MRKTILTFLLSCVLITPLLHAQNVDKEQIGSNYVPDYSILSYSSTIEKTKESSEANKGNDSHFKSKPFEKTVKYNGQIGLTFNALFHDGENAFAVGAMTTHGVDISNQFYVGIGIDFLRVIGESRCGFGQESYVIYPYLDFKYTDFTLYDNDCYVVVRPGKYIDKYNGIGIDVGFGTELRLLKVVRTFVEISFIWRKLKEQQHDSSFPGRNQDITFRSNYFGVGLSFGLIFGK